MRYRFFAYVITLYLLVVAAQLAVWPTPQVHSAAPITSGVASEEARPLARVMTIGASVTDGFLLKADLSEMIEAMFRDEDFVTATFSTSFFFANPDKNGKQAIEFLGKNEPTMVVALDFLFWFGYGAIGPHGGRIQAEEERLALLEHGLGLLEDLDVPLLVGDFPNMSSAVGRGMLQASQQPEAETLDRLNERVHEWAAARKQTIVIPLSEVVEVMRAGEAFKIGAHEWPADSTERVLMPDHLHPTFEGLAGIAHLIGSLIIEGELATEDELEIDLVTLLESFGEELDDE